MPIVPDTADWTWVLNRACPECQFDTQTVTWTSLPTLLEQVTDQWVSILTERDREWLGVRPSEDRWSPLEYGCHVRDVFVLFKTRLDLMLNEDGPRFPNWDQDRTAVEQRYLEQDPRLVALAVRQAGYELAQEFGAVDPDGLVRKGFRSDGATFTVESFGRYMIHDPVHHLSDLGEAKWWL